MHGGFTILLLPLAPEVTVNYLCHAFKKKWKSAGLAKLQGEVIAQDM